MSANNLNCELFVNYSGDRETLKINVASLIVGVAGKFGVVESALLSINIKENELYNSEKYGGKIPDSNDQTIKYYYKYRINIEPIDESIDKYIYI